MALSGSPSQAQLALAIALVNSKPSEVSIQGWTALTFQAWLIRRQSISCIFART